MGTRQILEEIAELLTVKMQERLASQGLKDSTLYTNIEHTVIGDEDDGFWELEMAIPNHGIYVNDGRKKGARMPPSKPIREWMKKKRIKPKLEFAIRKGISKNGIKARPYINTPHGTMELVNDILFDGEVDTIDIELNKILKKLQ